MFEFSALLLTTKPVKIKNTCAQKLDLLNISKNKHRQQIIQLFTYFCANSSTDICTRFIVMNSSPKPNVLASVIWYSHNRNQPLCTGHMECVSFLCK